MFQFDYFLLFRYYHTKYFVDICVLTSLILFVNVWFNIFLTQVSKFIFYAWFGTPSTDISIILWKNICVTVMFPLWQHLFLCNCFFIQCCYSHKSTILCSWIHLVWFDTLFYTNGGIYLVLLHTMFNTYPHISLVWLHTIFCVRLVLPTRVLHSEHRCLSYHNIFILV